MTVVSEKAMEVSSDLLSSGEGALYSWRAETSERVSVGNPSL
jgi:hypothetical protein